MTPSLQQPSQTINDVQNTAINVLHNCCAIVTMPVEMLLRPQYGSEYFPAVLTLFTGGLMILLPAFSEIGGGLSRMLPIMRFQGPAGLFGIASISKLFFLTGFIHGLRVWRRMIHMELEENSFYVGPPLFIFRCLPLSWWVTRIIAEPLCVFTLAVTLRNFYILQASAANYLMIAAIALALKEYTEWLKQWQYIRHLMNIQTMGPIINKIVNNTATKDERAKIHLASFPENIPDEVRRAAARHMAHVYSPES
jgi:hypothetical protein